MASVNQPPVKMIPTTAANSTMMLHRSKIVLNNLSVDDAQSTLDSFRELDEKFYEVYRERSGKEIPMPHKDSRYTAKQAVESGLADAVLKNRRP